MKLKIGILLALLLSLMIAEEASAAVTIVNPTNNQNITTDITARFNVDASYNNLTIWAYQSAWQIVSTNTTTMPANTEYNITLAKTDLADGNWTLMAEGNRSGSGAANSSTLASIGFDDTIPTTTIKFDAETLAEGSRIKVTVTGSDTGFSTNGISYCELRKVAESKTVNMTDAGSDKFTHTYLPSALGANVVQANCWDNHGWNSNTAKKTFYLADTSGGITIREPTSQEKVLAMQNYIPFFIAILGAVLLLLLLIRRR